MSCLCQKTGSDAVFEHTQAEGCSPLANLGGPTEVTNTLPGSQLNIIYPPNGSVLKHKSHLY